VNERQTKTSPAGDNTVLYGKRERPVNKDRVKLNGCHCAIAGAGVKGVQ